MPMYFTIGELVLGGLAWGLGAAALLLRRRQNTAQKCGMGSFACCGASLCLVVFDLAHMADIEDVSAFLDTANAFRLAAGVLLAGTLILNIAAVVMQGLRKEDK